MIPQRIPMHTFPPAPDAGGTQPAADRVVAAGPVLRLVVQGFNKMERILLEGTVRLSQRRMPRLELLAAQQHRQADVVMIDTRDEAAMAWARSVPGLDLKTVIWVDGTQAVPGHTLSRRPVQWPVLPMLLARALEEAGRSRAATAQPQVSGVAAAQAEGAPRPILVVDDSQAVRAHMRSILERLGYAVEVASSAHAALQLLGESRFAMVFMDVLMPELDGYEACKRIKAQQRTLGVVPIVMLTSRNSPFDRIRGKMSGCDGYLIKPAETQALHDVLLRFADKPGKPVAHAEVPPDSELPTVPAPFDSRPMPLASPSRTALNSPLLPRRWS